MADGYLLEDGSGRLEIEDDAGIYLLEEYVPVPLGGGGKRPRRQFVLDQPPLPKHAGTRYVERPAERTTDEPTYESADAILDPKPWRPAVPWTPPVAAPTVRPSVRPSVPKPAFPSDDEIMDVVSILIAAGVL